MKQLSNVPVQISSVVKNSAAALLVYISRLQILPSNISPLGSFGFFSANPLYFAVSILAFDLFYGGHYHGYLFTYLGFSLYWVLGRVAGKNIRLQATLLPLASFSFFLISNAGVWWHWYPHTLEGLLTCYTLALPFYQNTLIGDFIFGYGYIAYKIYASRLQNVRLFSSVS